MPAVFLLMLYYLMFFSFTIYPPKAELFRDPLASGTGYLQKMLLKSTEKRRERSRIFCGKSPFFYLKQSGRLDMVHTNGGMDYTISCV